MTYAIKTETSPNKSPLKYSKGNANRRYSYQRH